MRRLSLALACGAGMVAILTANGALAQQRSFDLPREPAVRSIPEFARQAGLQIVAPADQLAGVTTQALHGVRDSREALRLLLDGTGLKIASDDGKVIALTRAANARTDTEASSSPPQPQAAEAATDVAPVTVTATKRETALMRTPLAVSAVSGKALQRDGVRDVRQLGSLVPSMQVGFSPSDSGVQVTIRGITSNNFTELGDPTVGIYFDGIYAPRPQSGMALMHDIERVEVLRGPQGTLYGRNSTAGAINILIRRPQFSGPSLLVETEYGNYNHRALRLVGNYPINDVLALRVAFSGERTDGYITQVQDKFDLNWAPYITADGIPNTDQRWNHPVSKANEYTSVNRWAARASLLYHPGPNFDWMITAEHYNDHSPGDISLQDCAKAAGTVFACDHPQFYASINVPGRMSMFIDSLRSEMSFRPMEGVKVEYRAGYTNERRSQDYDGDGGAFASPNNPAYGIANRSISGCCSFGPLVNDPGLITSLGFNPAAVAHFPFEDLQLRTRWSHYNSLVQELQIKSDGDTRLKWILGVFDLREKNAIRFDVDLPWCCGAPVPLAQSFVQPDRRVNSTAVFGQADYAATDKLNLTAGYRYTWDTKSDFGGSNHSTIGYWVAPGQFDPTGSFWQESWSLVGVVPGWNQEYQSNALTPGMGTSAPDFLTRVPGTDNSYKAKWSAGTWKIGFDYTANDNLFFYGSIATGFKAGGFGDKVDVCDCGQLETFPYKPETNTNYELGFKARLFNRKLNLIGTIYDSEYTNMQRTQWVIVGRSNNDPINGRYIGTLLTTNEAAARIRGAELEADWSPWAGGRITGWLTYTNAVITKDPGAQDGFFCFERAWLGLTACPAEDAFGNRPTSFVGHKLPWSPDWSATVNLEHSWTLPGGLRLSPYISAHWQSQMFFNDNNFAEGPFNFGQKAFITENASLRLISDRDHWGAELYVYNLSNQLVRSWADPGPGYMKGSFFPPRMFGLRFRKEY